MRKFSLLIDTAVREKVYSPVELDTAVREKVYVPVENLQHTVTYVPATGVPV